MHQPSPRPRSRRRRVGGPPHLACGLHRRRAHQPRPRKLGRLPAGRVVPRARGASVVNWSETEWYSHHQPKVGGALPPGTIHKPKTVTTVPSAATVAHLPPPSPIVPLASPPIAGRRTVVARRPSCRRGACGLPDTHSAQRDPHKLRCGRGMDGPDAAQGDAVFGQSDSRWRALHAHGAHFTERCHLG